MPHGELYIKYHSGMTGINTARYNYSNGSYTQNNSGTWVDAFDAWGVSLNSTALSQLMTPAPLKDMIENNSILENGRRVIYSNRKQDERSLTLGMNIIAQDEVTFHTHYANFCSQVLAYGRIILRTRYQASETYYCDYVSCQTFSEFIRQIGKFTLRLIEPNPSNRTI